MFVFIGLPIDYSTVNLDVVLERLNQTFSNHGILQFTRKDELISLNFEDVRFYISFIKSSNEISDWVQMANDFELFVDLNAGSKETLEKKYKKSKKLFPKLYNDNHYSIAKDIFEELNKTTNMTIFTFQ